MAPLSDCLLMDIPGLRQSRIVSSRLVSAAADCLSGQFSLALPGLLDAPLKASEARVFARKPSHRRPKPPRRYDEPQPAREIFDSRGPSLPRTQSMLVMACLGGLGYPGNVRNGLADENKRQQAGQKPRHIRVLSISRAHEQADEILKLMLRWPMTFGRELSRLQRLQASKLKMYPTLRRTPEHTRHYTVSLVRLIYACLRCQIE